MTDNLHARFIAWCQRVALPRSLWKSANLVAHILVMAASGVDVGPQKKQSAVAAIAKIETWKAGEP